MYKKMIVLELRDAYALAMEEGGSIFRIRRKEGLRAGDTVYVLPEDLYTDARRSSAIPFPAAAPAPASSGRHSRRWLHLGSLAAMLALCATLLLPRLSPAVYALASFDGASSVQVELDRKGQILSAVSPDGSVPPELLTALRGRDLEEAAGDLGDWCGGDSILVGCALLRSGEPAQALSQSVRELFPERAVVCLSGDAEDVRAADARGTSLGAYLIAQMAGSDLEDLLEDLPRDTLEQMLQEDPAWGSVPGFQEALEEQREEAEEEREAPSGSAVSPPHGPEGSPQEDERPAPPSEEDEEDRPGREPEKDSGSDPPAGREPEESDEDRDPPPAPETSGSPSADSRPAEDQTAEPDQDADEDDGEDGTSGAAAPETSGPSSADGPDSGPSHADTAEGDADGGSSDTDGGSSDADSGDSDADSGDSDGDDDAGPED